MADDKVALELDLIDNLSDEAIEAAQALQGFERRAKAADKALKRLNEITKKTGETQSSLTQKLKRQSAQFDSVINREKNAERARKQAASAQKQQQRDLEHRARATQRAQRVAAREARRHAREARMERARGLRESRKGLDRSLVGVKTLAAAYVGYRVAQKAAAMGAQFFNSVIGKANFVQKMQLSFEQLTGSQEKGALAWSKSRELSDKLGASIEDVSTRMRGFLAQAFTMDEAVTFSSLLSDLQIIGVEGERAQRVMFALTQIKSKGRLQAEELLQLAEAGVSLKRVKTELQSILGVGVEGLEKLQRKGGVGSDVALKAIKQGILKQLNSTEAGANAEKFAANTLQGAFNAFRNAKSNFLIAIANDASPAFEKLSNVIRNLSKAFTNKAALESFSKGFGRIGESIEKMSPKIIDGLGKSLENAGRAFEKLSVLGPAFFDGLIEQFDLTTFKDLFSEKTTGDAIKGAKQFGEVVGEKINKAADAAVRLANAIDRIASVIGTVSKVESFLSDTIGDFVNPLGRLGGDSHQKSQELGSNIVLGIIEGMDLNLPWLKSKMIETANVASSTFAGPKGIDAHSPSRKFAVHGKNAVLGIGAGAKKQESSLATSMVRTSGALSTAATAMPRGGGGVSQVFNNNFRNNFAVSGAQNPQATAKAVSNRETDSVFGAMISNKVAAGAVA